MLRGRRRKKLMRSIYALGSAYRLKHASLDETGRKDFWQAGRSVAGIDSMRPAGDIIREFAERARAAALD
jgi:nitronate monooxygenase